MANNNQILNRLFTLNSFNELLQYGGNSTYLAAIRNYVSDPESKSNGEILSEIYSFMSHSYRNEYYYENTLLNKLLLSIHKPSTTTALAQIPIHKSIADFILINGKAVVYEIKTELDSFDRLSSQVEDYYKAFTRVCVVTSENQFSTVSRILGGSPTGIFVLTSKNSISTTLRKEPVEHLDDLNYSVMFNVLRKGEFESILKRYFGGLPSATPAFYYEECLKLFQNIPIIEAYNLMLIELKKRFSISYESMIQAPSELRSLLYFSKPNMCSFSALDNFIKSKYGGC